MPDIKIDVTNKTASQIGTAVIVCGNADYTVTFTFDNEWGAYQEKTARFRFIQNGAKKFIDVLFSGSTCKVPILSNIETVSVGVYAGDLHTTTGAEVKCQRSILCEEGTEHEPPDPDVYNQILEYCAQKLGSNGGTVTGDYYKDGKAFIHEGNLDLLDGTDNVAIVKKATGNALTLDSSQAPLHGLKLFGKNTQDGIPTPDNPIELKSVGDSGSYSVDVYGKNLFVPRTDTVSINGVECTSNGNGTFILNGTATKDVSFNISPSFTLESGTYTFCARGLNKLNSDYDRMYINANGQIIANYIFADAPRTIQLTETSSVQLALIIGTGSTYTNATIKLQLEAGTVATEFEPYKEKQSITFTDTLRGVGDIADEKDFARGVKIQRFEKVVLNGSETWSVNTGEGYAQLYNYSIIANAKKNMIIFGMCSHVPSVNKMINSNYLRIASAPNGSGLLIHDTLGVWGLSENTELAFQNYLKAQYDDGTPMTIVYELETPIETPLTETELNDYKKLYTKKPNTTIISEAEAEVDYYVNKPNAQAVGNVHAQINKDYLKLQQAIITLGGSTL